MEPNGSVGQGQPAAQPVQPVPQQTNQGYQPQAQQPATQPTPGYQVAHINPQTGQPYTPAQPAAPAQPQTQADAFTQFRQQVATSLGVSVNDIPSDPAGLNKIVVGGYSAAQRLRQMEQQNLQPQPPASPVAPQPGPLEPKPMAPGWDRMVQRNAQGVFEPLHPSYASIAQDANYNEGVYAQRAVALNQGQMLPEQQKTVQEIVQQTLAKEREELRASMFMEANEKKLFALNPDGSRQTQLDINTGRQVPVPSELGIEMQQAAREIVESGAQFNSQHDLAKYALKIAEGRLQQKQAQQQQVAPPSQAQPMNNDLATLLNNHRQAGNTGVSNVNTLPQARSQDPRADFRALLQSVPDGLNGVDYLNFLRGRG